MSEPSTRLKETVDAREHAERLLIELIDCRAQSEARLAELSRSDVLKQVTGTSAMDNAIESTRKMIQTFGRIEDDLRRTLGDQDAALLD